MLEGTTAGTFGDLAVSNGVSLGGALSVKLVNGFVPVIGDSFTILTGSAVSGTFVTVKGTSINSSEHFEVNYGSTAVTLTVVSVREASSQASGLLDVASELAADEFYGVLEGKGVVLLGQIRPIAKFAS